MKYEQKYSFFISLSLPVLEKILLIDILKIEDECVFVDPGVKHWRYKLELENWISECRPSPCFPGPLNSNINVMILHVLDADSNSAIGIIKFE